MKNVQGPKISQADFKHAAILGAAQKVFLKQGFKAASMDEVAQQANVSKKTVYDHFDNKKGLFEAMLKEHWHKLLRIDTALFDERKTIAENLAHFAKVFLRFLYQQETIDLFRLLIGEANQFPELAEHIIVDGKPPFTKKLVEYLNQKKTSGELNIDNAERAALYFMGLLKEQHFWPMMLGFTKQKKIANPNKLIDEAVAIFLKAFGL